MTSPLYANRLSARTVLFTCVPQQMLDEAKLRKVFGDSVRNVWISRDTDELDHLVKEREQTAFRLEKAEIVLIKKANAARNIAVQNSMPTALEQVVSAPTPQTRESSTTINPERIVSDTEISFGADPDIKLNNYSTDISIPDVNGSVAAQWLPVEQRPRHRPIANYGRRVDTIKWTRSRLKILNGKINKLRRQQQRGKGRPIPAVFIEFDTQVNAQAAYQALTHHRALHMHPRFIGVRPYEVVWSSLRMTWWGRIVRRFLIQGFIFVMILFWAIPCALVGIISNINFLAKKVSFLSWILLLPTPILGLITGLLPALALSLLMAIVPAILRRMYDLLFIIYMLTRAQGCARFAGVPSLSMIELFVQNGYFAFQVVQVFLITTLTSAASAAFTDILKDPMSIRTLLSANLPKASNFYVSYFILQGLASSASRIVHFSALFRHQVLKNASENPRFLANRWHRLRKVHWGSQYPVSTNMAVIGKCTSILRSHALTTFVSSIIATLLTSHSHQLCLHRASHTRFRRRRLLPRLSILPLQSPLRLRLPNRHFRPPLPTCLETNLNRSLPRRNLSPRSIRPRRSNRPSPAHAPLARLHRPDTLLPKRRPRSPSLQPTEDARRRRARPAATMQQHATHERPRGRRCREVRLRPR